MSLTIISNILIIHFWYRIFTSQRNNKQTLTYCMQAQMKTAWLKYTNCWYVKCQIWNCQAYSYLCMRNGGIKFFELSCLLRQQRYCVNRRSKTILIKTVFHCTVIYINNFFINVFLCIIKAFQIVLIFNVPVKDCTTKGLKVSLI